MNQSQLVLQELSKDPERAIKFLKNLNTLIGLQKRNWSRIVIGYLLGVLTSIVLMNIF